MEERVIWICLFLLLSLWSATRCFYYFFTPEDDLYSEYRNRIDRSPKDFKFRLFVSRFLWGALSFTFFSGTGVSIFF